MFKVKVSLAAVVFTTQRGLPSEVFPKRDHAQKGDGQVDSLKAAQSDIKAASSFVAARVMPQRTNGSHLVAG